MVVAVTLTPVLCSYLLTGEKVLKRNEKEPIVSRTLKKVYRRALEWVLVHKRLVLGSTFVLLVGALVVFFSLGRNFLPPFNEGSLTINASTEHALGVNVSELEAPFELIDRSRDEFMAAVRARLSVLRGVNIEIGQPIAHRIDAMLSGTQANIAIKLFGPDLNRLFSLGTQIKNAVAPIEGIADLNLEQQIERNFRFGPNVRCSPNTESRCPNFPASSKPDWAVRSSPKSTIGGVRST